jgi:RNA polymerase sigma-70 factor (ECF subfamily)
MKESNMTDGLLVERSQLGDCGAMDQLLHNHQAQAYLYAFRLSRDADEAGDIVAETLVRMFKAIPGFKGNSSFTTWMYRIITNCYLDMRKKKQRRPTLSLEGIAHTVDGDVPFQFEDRGPSAFDLAAENEEMKALQIAVHRLSDGQRTILTLHHGDSKSYEDISGMLDMPMGTVKSKLNRARRSLCDLMEEHSTDEIGTVRIKPESKPIPARQMAAVKMRPKRTEGHHATKVHM